MSDRPGNFQLDELTAQLTAIDKLQSNMLISLVTDNERVNDIKSALQNRFLRKNIRLNKKDCEEFFNVSIDYGKQSVIWNNPDSEFIIKRFLLYAKKSIDDVNPQGMNGLRKNLLCLGMVSEPDKATTSDENIDYVNRLCDTVGISFTASGKRTPDTKKQETKSKREQRLQKINDEIRTPSADGKPKTMQKIKDVARDPRDTVPVSVQQISETGTNTPTIGTSFLSNGLNFVLYKPSEADTKPGRKAIIDNYFYEDTITLLYGQAGSYKTMFAIWEGISLVLGKELCGMPINTTGHKVLYMSLEMTAKDIASRLNSMTKDLTPDEKKLIDENFIIISAEDTKLTAKTNNLLTALADLCNNHGIDIVYIDSFADYVAGFDLRSEGDMTAIINDLRQFVLDNHVSFRIIHHGTKPTLDSSGSMAGIHTIRDLSDYVYLIKADSEKEITISSSMQKDKSAKSRYSEPVTLLTKFVSDNGSISFVRIDETQTTSHIEQVSKLLSIIRDNQGIPSGELRDKMGNPKNFTKLVDGVINAGSVIMNTVPSNRGSAKKCYYTTDHYNEFTDKK